MALTVLGWLLASAMALAAAPMLMPAGYSWVANTTSESAAQGVAGGWLARLGFAFTGAVVVTATLGRHGRWGPLDSVAMLAAVAVPLGMSVWPAAGGLLQRLMFAVAYAWYAVEAVRVTNGGAGRVTSGRARGGPNGCGRAAGG